jgi:hypothetical protein
MPNQKPDWRELVQAKLDREPVGTRSSAIRVNARIDRAIKDAAAARNMSVTAYIRRAAVAFAVADLDLSWDTVMIDEPGFGLAGENPGRAVIRPNGHGFGAWQIVKLTRFHADD